MSSANQGQTAQAVPVPANTQEVHESKSNVADEALMKLLEPLVLRIVANTFEVYKSVNEYQDKHIAEVAIDAVSRDPGIRKAIEKIVQEMIGNSDPNRAMKRIALEAEMKRQQLKMQQEIYKAEVMSRKMIKEPVPGEWIERLKNWIP